MKNSFFKIKKKTRSNSKVAIWIPVFLLAFLNYSLLLGNKTDNHYLHFCIWLLNIILFLFVFSKKKAGTRWVSKKIKSKESLIILGLLLLAVILRISFLELAPGNISGDEMTQAMKAWEFAQNKRADIFSSNEWYSTPNFYYFITSFLFRFFGKSVWVWRFGSVIFGSLTVVFSYYLFSLLFSRKVGIISALLLSFYHLHIHFSRIGAHQITDAFWLVLIFWLFFKAIKEKRQLLFGLTGILLGVSQNFYFGSRILPLLIMGVGMAVAFGEFNKKRLGDYLKNLCILFFGFLVGFYPFFARYCVNPETYPSRTNQVLSVDLKESVKQIGIVYRPLFANSLRNNVLKTLEAFYSSSTTQWYAPQYPIVNRIALPFLIIGMALSLKNIKKKQYFFLVFSFLLPMTIVGVLIEDPPAGQRIVLVTPLIVGLLAIAINWLYDFVCSISATKIATTMLVAVVLFIGGADLYQYFWAYIPKNSFGATNSLAVNTMSSILKNASQKTTVYFYASPRLWFYSFSNLRFITPQVTGIDVKPGQQIPRERNSSQTIYIALPERVGDLKNDVGDILKQKIWGVYFSMPKSPSDRLSYYVEGKEKFISIVPFSEKLNLQPLFYIYDPAQLVISDKRR